MSNNDFDLSINGLDEVQGFLDKAEKGVKELDGKNEVELGAVLTDNFISTHTKFNDFDSWWKSSGFDVSDPHEVPDADLASFIKETSDFNSYDAMVEDALGGYLANKLGFDN
ncbi:hypothetical protein [Levilactobacillus angrenensis]|uniref:Uncharacterized protein n=1 Tax=Levilactobacillus angrenensis TaxID=2486020 RepID=A0ABW1UAQ6_9LACO|nr:hypothetical protein [Levilactobacillus angrenensis]